MYIMSNSGSVFTNACPNGMVVYRSPQEHWRRFTEHFVAELENCFNVYSKCKSGRERDFLDSHACEQGGHEPKGKWPEVCNVLDALIVTQLWRHGESKVLSYVYHNLFPFLNFRIVLLFFPEFSLCKLMVAEAKQRTVGQNSDGKQVIKSPFPVHLRSFLQEASFRTALYASGSKLWFLKS